MKNHILAVTNYRLLPKIKINKQKEEDGKESNFNRKEENDRTGRILHRPNKTLEKLEEQV